MALNNMLHTTGKLRLGKEHRKRTEHKRLVDARRAFERQWRQIEMDAARLHAECSQWRQAAAQPKPSLVHGFLASLFGRG